MYIYIYIYLYYILYISAQTVLEKYTVDTVHTNC